MFEYKKLILILREIFFDILPDVLVNMIIDECVPIRYVGIIKKLGNISSVLCVNDNIYVSAHTNDNVDNVYEIRTKKLESPTFINSFDSDKSFRKLFFYENGIHMYLHTHGNIVDMKCKYLFPLRGYKSVYSILDVITSLDGKRI